MCLLLCVQFPPCGFLEFKMHFEGIYEIPLKLFRSVSLAVLSLDVVVITLVFVPCPGP